ncbi:MAG: hypothetical protein K0R28_1027 [Paenibacillus sp.]|nr:hypothetical protein [Paenibacillus sp.]
MILKLFGLIALYAVILYLGTISMIRKGQRTDAVWYACLIGLCAYASLGKLYGWPPLGIVSPANALFRPAGKWMEQLMGGPPNG